jgi:hypothetical protein
MQKLNNRPQIPAALEEPAGCVSQAGDGVSILVRMPPKSNNTKACGNSHLSGHFWHVNWPLLRGIPTFPCSQGQL